MTSRAVSRGAETPLLSPGTRQAASVRGAIVDLALSYPTVVEALVELADLTKETGETLTPEDFGCIIARAARRAGSNAGVLQGISPEGVLRFFQVTAQALELLERLVQVCHCCIQPALDQMHSWTG